MATIPQELQDAWDKAQQARDDHAAAAAKLLDLQNQELSIESALVPARQDETTKGSLLDQARLAFDQTADRLLSDPTVTTPPSSVPVVTQPTSTQTAA